MPVRKAKLVINPANKYKYQIIVNSAYFVKSTAFTAFTESL